MLKRIRNLAKRRLETAPLRQPRGRQAQALGLPLLPALPTPRMPADQALVGPYKPMDWSNPLPADIDFLDRQLADCFGKNPVPPPVQIDAMLRGAGLSALRPTPYKSAKAVYDEQVQQPAPDAPFPSSAPGGEAIRGSPPASAAEKTDASAQRAPSESGEPGEASPAPKSSGDNILNEMDDERRDTARRAEVLGREQKSAKFVAYNERRKATLDADPENLNILNELGGPTQGGSIGPAQRPSPPPGDGILNGEPARTGGPDIQREQVLTEQRRQNLTSSQVASERHSNDVVSAQIQSAQIQSETRRNETLVNDINNRQAAEGWRTRGY